MSEFKGLRTDGTNVEPMSESSSRVFVQCCFMDRMPTCELEKNPVVMALFDRVMALNIIYTWLRTVRADVSIPVQLFCGAISTTPAEAAMWAYTLNQLAHDWGGAIDMDDLAEAFPWGFPTKAFMDSCWDAQKCADKPLGNLVDDPTPTRARMNVTRTFRTSSRCSASQ